MKKENVEKRERMMDCYSKLARPLVKHALYKTEEGREIG